MFIKFIMNDKRNEKQLPCGVKSEDLELLLLLLLLLLLPKCSGLCEVEFC